MDRLPSTPVIGGAALLVRIIGDVLNLQAAKSRPHLVNPSTYIASCISFPVQFDPWKSACVGQQKEICFLDDFLEWFPWTKYK